MNNGFFTGIKYGIGIGIGIMVIKEAKKAYDRYMLKRSIKGFWSGIKKAWNDVTS